MLDFLGSVARDDVSRAGWLREPVTTIAFLLTFSLIAASGLLGHPPAPRQIQGKQPKQIQTKNTYVILVLIWHCPRFRICWGWICNVVSFGSFLMFCRKTKLVTFFALSELHFQRSNWRFCFSCAVLSFIANLHHSCQIFYVSVEWLKVNWPSYFCLSSISCHH